MLHSLALEYPRASPDIAVAIDDPELDVEAVQPLVVVDRRPMKETAHVDAAGDRCAGYLKPALEVVRALGVVIGADAVFGHQKRSPGKHSVQPVEHEAKAVCRDAVAQR